MSGIEVFVPWAQCASVVAAGAGALFAGVQVLRARRAAALQGLQEFFKAISERERALVMARYSDNAEDASTAFVDLMNCLEVYAAAHGGRLFSGVASELVRDKLVDSIVVIEGAHDWYDEIDRAVDSEIVFKHLLLFRKRHRRMIAARSEARRRHRLDASSRPTTSAPDVSASQAAAPQVRH